MKRRGKEEEEFIYKDRIHIHASRNIIMSS